MMTKAGSFILDWLKKTKGNPSVDLPSERQFFHDPPYDLIVIYHRGFGPMSTLTDRRVERGRAGVRVERIAADRINGTYPAVPSHTPSTKQQTVRLTQTPIRSVYSRLDSI
jgi:hypothetical protein